MTMIDSREMRDRVLAKMEQASSEKIDWQKALSVDGNRRLLALIIAKAPTSINALAQLAERAQPNVSRSLATLVRSGLVELRQNGRATAPVPTVLGMEKAETFELASISEAVAASPVMPFTEAPDGLMSVAPGAPSGRLDQVAGEMAIILHGRDRAICRAHGRGDLTELGSRWLADWWRILYRRDAPYRLCDLAIDRGNVRQGAVILASSSGRQIHLWARLESSDGDTLEQHGQPLALVDFERSMESGVIAPVARELNRRGELDRPLQTALAHIAEIRGDLADLTYWRTAGALGLTGLSLDAQGQALVRDLIASVSDEEGRLELASALLTDEVEDARVWIADELKQQGDRNRLFAVNDMARSARVEVNLAGLKPQYRGIELAKHVRKKLKLQADQPLGGLPGLAGCMGAPDYVPGRTAPGQLLGFRSLIDDVPVVVANGDGGDASAFTLARAVGDQLAFGGPGAPIVEIYTDRQKVGRAFAAELIAPSAAVVDMIDKGLSWQRVGRHFGASPAVIRHQFDNNAWRRGDRRPA